MSFFRNIKQDIKTSENNFTEDNLASGATFTGTADETLGINGIQLFHSSDRDCIIYIDQSTDNTFADSTQTVTDSFTCLANTPCTRTFISVAPYYRLRVKNNGTTITTKLATYTGMTPIINPLPRSLTDDGRLITESTITGKENEERHAWINPTNEQAISPVYRMVGTNFDGSTKDTNFWIDGSLESGTVEQSGGEIDLHTNAITSTPASSAKYTSVRKSRFVAGSAQYFSGGFNFKTAATANNIRRVGAYTTNTAINTPIDGFYFELNNATFSVNSRANSGTVNSVTSFNGNYGPSWAPTADTYYSLTIEWTPLAAFFYVNGKLLHKMQGAHLSYYMTLPITIENLNTSGSVDVSFESVGMYISRSGELITNPTSKFTAAGQQTTICKYGAGTIRGLIISAITSTAVVDIYDGLTTGGTLIWSSGSLPAKQEPIHIDFYSIPFSDGLTIDVNTANAAVLVAYE